MGRNAFWDIQKQIHRSDLPSTVGNIFFTSYRLLKAR